MPVVMLLSKFQCRRDWPFLEKIPQKTYISREEKTMPGFKAVKDRLTLMLGGNASGDFKLKPGLVYRAGNPRAFKNITKSSLLQALKAVEDDHNTTLSDFGKTFNISCVKHIDVAWHEVSQTNMSGVWKFLCPQFVNNFQEFQQEDKKILENLVGIFKKLDINLDEEGFEKLFEPHSQELTNEEPMELETMQRQSEQEDDEEILPIKKFETKMMAKGFSLIEKALAIFQNQDPNDERFSKVATSVRDSFECYRIIWNEKKRKTAQTSLDQFFKKRDDPRENFKSVVENLLENVEAMPSSICVSSPLPSSLYDPSDVDGQL
ncbi:Tigger transposable element-derived protein 1-like isoform X4 [Oopsacas minuta]|uniref:Tigger transposable element-derived protein 1-like isoform X4 n=1 Tax=Oopsacas minuta TaxID=111878 RepID=A0AAV7JDR0_9METZ|nr:Tigger transposable element-derived protein 1-like isoform X4 [Oopsacas minuta]